MKIIFKIVITLLIIIGIGGAAIYYFGTSIASEQIMTYVNDELLKEENLDEIKEMIDVDPQLKAFLTDASDVSNEALPFTTSEEATKAILKKIDMNEMKEVASQLKGGISKEEQEELMQLMEEKLSEEEINALKVIAYKELNK
ncbi:hypothetical protein RZN25_14035 [Bacillaceae bacterium S4-13-56]